MGGALLLVGLVTAALIGDPDRRPTLMPPLLSGADAAEVTLDGDARAAARVGVNTGPTGDDPTAGTTDPGSPDRHGTGPGPPGPARDDGAVDHGFEVADDTLATGRVPCIPDGCARWSLALGPGDQFGADAEQIVIATASRVLAIDTRTAQGRWQIAVPPGDGPVVSVHLLDDAVLLNRTGRLELRGLADGAARWSQPLELADITDVQRLGGILLATAGTVPDTPAAAVVALDVDTGTVRWTREVPDVRRAVLRVEHDRLAVQTSLERVVGVDPATGRSRWVRAGRVGFTDAAVLLAAPDGRVERLHTASGDAAATISTNVADVLATGRWTVVRDRDATSRLIDDRGGTVDERDQPALALAAEAAASTAPSDAGAGAPGGALVAYRDGDDIEVVRYDGDGAISGRRFLPGGLDVWGSAPRLGLRGDVGLVVSQDMRRSLRLTIASGADGDTRTGSELAADTRSWPAGTATSVLDEVLVAARTGDIELRGTGATVRLDGRLRQVRPVGDDVLVRTTDGVVQIDGDVLGR